MARDRFRKLVDAQTEATPTLPFVRNTDVYGLVNALADDKLVPQGCTVFVGEPLLYFFYGRPSYRVNANEKPTSLEHYLPVCLLFRSAAIHPIKRVFPFDTGAFKNDMYRDALHKKMELNDFGLAPDPSTPGRVISLFFGSVEAYLSARADSSSQFDPAIPEAVSYHALITQRLSNSVDNRVSGIEVQLEGELDLDGNVEAVVLPSTLLDSPTLQAQLLAKKIAPLPYAQIERQRPSEYVTKIFEICSEYYKRVGLVK